MTPAVLEKFKEGKVLYESGANELLPLLQAIQDGEAITGNSAEYKALVKAIDGLSEPMATEPKPEPTVTVEANDDTDINDDGLVKGKALSEKEYWALINKQRVNSKK